MTREKLKRCNEIECKMNEIISQIHAVKHTQFSTTVPRDVRIEMIFENKQVVVPESLYKTIGKLILDDYKEKLNKLEKEFFNL